MPEALASTVFKVIYDTPSAVLNDMLNGSFKALEFHERIDGGWSIATHRFGMRGESGGNWLEQIKPELEKMDPLRFKFQIVNLGETEKQPKQNHILIPWKEIVSRSPSGFFNVYTIEKRAKMHLDPIFAVRAAPTIAAKSGPDIVRHMIEHYGFEASPIEDTKSINEFKILHQPGWTDHDMINDHLIPRSVNEKGEGVYNLFSNEGDKVGYCTLTYQATPQKPYLGQVMSVETSRDLWNPTIFGAESVGLSVDPFKLQLYQVGDKGTRPNILPDTSSKEVVETMNKASKRHAWWRKYFQVTLFGDKTMGSTPFPFILDLKGSKYKEDDNQQGYAVMRYHDIRGGSYRLIITAVQT